MTTPVAAAPAPAATPTAPSRAAFGRALRRLDAPDARQFVADLLAARGYRTTVDGRIVTAASGAGRTRRLLVVTGAGSIAAGVPGPVDAVVTAGGPVAGAVGALLARLAARRDDPPDRVGPGTLREWLVYAVDEDDRAALTDRYLTATEPTAVGRAVGAVAGGLSALAGAVEATDRPSRRAAAAVLVALVAVAAVVAAGPLSPAAPPDPASGGGDGGDGSGAGVTGTATSAGAATATGSGSGPGTATPNASAVPVGVSTGTGAVLPEACPLAPVGVHPATLRPAVISGVSVGGLEGWQLLATQNLTRYDFDPNDQQAGVVPELRHIAVYERPTGTRYRLRIDRWGSSGRAREAVRRNDQAELAFPWGAYTVWVTWRTGDAGRPGGERLLAAVTTAEGVRLGRECVRAMIEEFGPTRAP